MNFKTIAFFDAGILRPTIITERLQLAGNQRFEWARFVNWLKSTYINLADFHYFDGKFEVQSEDRIAFHSFLQNELKIKLHLLPIGQKTERCVKCGTTWIRDI